MFLLTLIALLPLCISGSNVQFYQFIANNPVPLNNDYSTLHATSKTYFIVHGWTENGLKDEYILMAQNYQALDATANIILVDYKDLAAQSYLQARQIVNTAGTEMGTQIVAMLDANALFLTNIHFFGHSLGTHVAGQAAQVIKNRTGNKVPRISASDPAGPLFRSLIIFGFLDPLQKTVTDFLDVTHTSYLMGTIIPFGHVDTYVQLETINQPECMGKFDMDSILWCSHRSARSYFTESILSCGLRQRRFLLGVNSILSFVIRLLISFNLNLTDLFVDPEFDVYGQHMSLDQGGVYFMSVNAESPFGKFDEICTA